MKKKFPASQNEESGLIFSNLDAITQLIPLDLSRIIKSLILEGSISKSESNSIIALLLAFMSPALIAAPFPRLRLCDIKLIYLQFDKILLDPSLLPSSIIINSCPLS